MELISKATRAGIAALLATACAAPESDRTLPPAEVAIVNVTLVDLEGEMLTPGSMILIEAGEIVAVASSAPGNLPDSVVVIPGDGRFAVPGLWDSHVHAFTDDAVERVLPLFLAHGVTHVRDMASNLEDLQAVRERLSAQPDAVAPHIIAAGPLLESRALPWYGDVLMAIESPEAARRELPRLAEAGVDFFKVYGGLSAETYAAVHAEADRLGLEVAGHVPSAVGLQGVAEAAQLTVEHIDFSTLQSCGDGSQDWLQRSTSARFQDGYGAYYEVLLEFYASLEWERCAAAFEALAENGGHFTPTLVMELHDRSRISESAIDYLSTESAQWCRTTLSNIDAADATLRESAYDAVLAAFARIRGTGIPILAGSDTPNFCLAPGASLHWELDRLHEGGLTRAEALRAATVTPARAFGLEDRFGRLAAGYAADVVLFDANPLEGPPGFPAGVFTQGSWRDGDQLETIRSSLGRETGTPTSP